jgi:hypothetical protein
LTIYLVLEEEDVVPVHSAKIIPKQDLIKANLICIQVVKMNCSTINVGFVILKLDILKIKHQIWNIISVYSSTVFGSAHAELTVCYLQTVVIQ